MVERQHTREHEQREQTPEQLRDNENNVERLRKNAERNAERSKENNAEKLEQSRQDVERVAEKQQKTAVESAPERVDTRPDVATRSERKQAYDAHMDQARSHMKPAGRTFSKVIHNRAVETASDITGKTVARPNAILAGSFTAFVMVLGVFLVARHYGYPLSGSESIIAFAAGWVLGVLFDYLRVMITGRHQ